MNESIRATLAEGIGTFMLVFAGTGAIIINDVSGGAITHMGIAAAFGLVVATVIYAYGDVSGAHLNPAVTLAFWLSKRFPGRQVLPYVIVQFLGALAASFTLRTLFPAHESLGGTLPNGSVSRSFLFEVLLTWWLMVVILEVSEGAKEKGIVAGIIIGSTVALSALFAGPICGASMNPARSLGPAVASGQLQHLWLYLIAPVIGSSLSVASCYLIKGQTCRQDKPAEHIP